MATYKVAVFAFPAQPSTLTISAVEIFQDSQLGSIEQSFLCAGASQSPPTTLRTWLRRGAGRPS